MLPQTRTIIREDEMFKWPMLAAAALEIALQPAEVEAQRVPALARLASIEAYMGGGVA
jgi:hypothetical protein